MKMVIADPLEINGIILSDLVTSRLITAGLLLFLVLFTPVNGQTKSNVRHYSLAESALNNGEFQTALEIAERGLENSRKSKSEALILKGLDLLASSQISLRKYELAEKSLNEALQILPESEANAFQKAQIYLSFAWLQRSQRKFAEAFDFCKKAMALAPDNQQIKGEYFLNIGRILFSSGYDISAIIWLEKAEQSFETEKTSPGKLDTYRFLSLAWSSKLNYQTALKYTEKWVSIAENSPFKQKYRQAFFDQGTILSVSGQSQKASIAWKKGLNLSLEQKDSNQSRIFLTSLLLHSLDKAEMTKALDYLGQLEKLDTTQQFSFEIKLGKAIIAAFNGDENTSEKYFTELEKVDNSSEFILPIWKIIPRQK